MDTRFILVIAIATIVGVGAAVGINSSVNGDPYACTLSFDLDGADGTVPGSVTVTEGETVELPSADASKEHYAFSGWSDGTDTYQPGTAYKVLYDVKLTAVWTPDTYSITYVLDGGTLPEGTATTYTYGTSAALPTVEKKGCIFVGWYIDEGLTESITSITRDMYGDLTLYAALEESQVGYGTSFRLTGESVTKDRFDHVIESHSSSGMLSFDYVYYEYGSGYYVQRIYDMTVDGVDNDSTDGYWSGELDREWTVADATETIDTDYGSIECEVWSTVTTNTGLGYRHQSTETHYIGVGDGIEYRITNVTVEKNSFTGRTATETTVFDLCDSYTFDAEHYYSVEVYEDRGVTVGGDESPVTGSEITLTASASDQYVFGGWYSSEGTLISSNTTLSVGRLFSDVKVLAKNTSDHDDMVSIDGETQYKIITNTELTDIQWTVTHAEQETSGIGDSVVIDTCGLYNIVYSGKDSSETKVYGTYCLVVEGAYNFSWTYNSKPYNIKLEYISYEDYIKNAESDTGRTIGTDEHSRQFVTYNDKYIVSLAKKFEDLSNKYGLVTDLDKVRLVLSYVQSIPYAYDSDTKGTSEYWKYPLETVFDGSGDCEDTSILFCAIVKAMDYDTALMTLYATNDPDETIHSGSLNHCVGLISVDGVSVSDPNTVKSYVQGGVTYWFCETTSTGHDVGENNWAKIGNETIIVI